jgi:hypothetical protein
MQHVIKDHQLCKIMILNLSGFLTTASVLWLPTSCSLRRLWKIKGLIEFLFRWTLGDWDAIAGIMEAEVLGEEGLRMLDLLWEL